MRKLSEQERISRLRNLYRINLYVFLRLGLRRADTEVEWIINRCEEVQANPNGYLDLWARDHYKSTIVTFAKSMQDIIQSHGDDPLPIWNGREVTLGIFSHTRPMSKHFLRPIKRECETNEHLKLVYPDIFYDNPEKESPKWSEDDGIIVKRKSNPPESTVEAWGMIDGQPIGKHFVVRNYDDVVTKESVRSPEMMAKTTEMWELSLALGTRGGFERYVGTRYHCNDTYNTMMKRKAAIPRIHTATHNGKIDGIPVLLSREELDDKRKKMGPYTFGCQMLQNPTADSVMGFKTDWMQFYEGEKDGVGMNLYILVDPANEKKKKSDYTAMFVIGCALDGNIYVLDMIRDRVNLLERTAALFELHRKWKNPRQKIRVGYEKYGMQTDIEHIKEKMEQENYRFEIMEVGGSMAKRDRILRLVPDFEQGNIYFPKRLNYVNNERSVVDLVDSFINDEFVTFPVGEHDDMLDALARMKDINIVFPMPSRDYEPLSIPTMNRI